MARLVVKSPYFKGGGGAIGYLEYIGTRERVEIIPDDRPPTRRQEQLIQNILRDFPDSRQLREYESYEAAHTKRAASAFISTALEVNKPAVNQSEVYMKYIATRPRAERIGDHGLFGDEDHVDLEKAMAEIENYPGNVWGHIISLQRGDAARFGYDSAEAWRDLLRAHRGDIAAAMHIPPDNFRWYAAFHDEGDHPHVHMMAWSTQPGQAYLTRDGIRQIKSGLTNDIFKHEMLHLYEQKSEQRDGLVREANREMKRLVREMRQSVCGDPVIESLMLELSQQLSTVKGKKSYGYLPKTVKPLVDQVVDAMEKLPVVAECYNKWWELQCQVMDFYSEQERQHPPLSQQKEFRSIKNAVIREAENIRMGKITFEDRGIEQEDEPLEEHGSSWLYSQLRYVIFDTTLSLEGRDEAVEEMERLAEDGDVHAQYLMGMLYRDGPLLIPDLVRAKRWFTAAAEQGHDGAQYALGKLLLSSEPEVHDSRQGIRWLEQSAESGNLYAAYRLGKEYLTGKNVVRDTVQAARYLTNAAEAGNQYAQYMLGKLYLTGIGVPKDTKLADYRLGQAASQGNEYAELLLARQDSGTAPSVLLSVTHLLYEMSRVFQDNTRPASGAVGMKMDRKLRRRMQEKRIAMGHKPDDHEIYQGPSMSM